MVVAIIGASNNSSKFGNIAVRSFASNGHTVFPVNPHCAELGLSIEGLKSYRNVLEIPWRIDVASLYVPANVGEQILSDLAKKRIPEIWVNPGAESTRLINRAKLLHLKLVFQCSIVAIGDSPANY